jgi:hypothetical protein
MSSPLTKQKGLLWVDPVQFARVQQQLIRAKRVTKPVDISKLVNTSILAKAYGGKTHL